MMAAVQRLCTIEDKPYLRALWQRCFGDTDSFLDFYYDSRFYPEYTVCTIEDDKLVNAMYSFPVNMYIRGMIVPAAMLAGFCTDPDYRGRGYMSTAFEILVNNLADSGIAVGPHTPVKHDSYVRQGNYTATETRFIEGIAEKPKIMPPYINFGRMSEIGKLYSAYTKFSERYSGILARSLFDFKMKFMDLVSDGGEFIIFDKHGTASGYALYFNGVDGLNAVEVVYDNDETAANLVNALSFISDNKPLKIKLPPDSCVELAGCEEKIIPHGVAAPVDLPKLMRMVFKEDNIAVKLEDHVCKINNGVFCMNGVKDDGRNPDIEMSAGYFMQFAEGYKTIQELAEEGHAVINNIEAAKYLDNKYPKQTCYICDEY